MELFTLGELYVSDFLKEGERPRGEKVEMKLMMDENGCVKLEKQAPHQLMWGKYFYRSKINPAMMKQLKNIVDSILDIYTLRQEDLWIDIACNDGGLLSFVPDTLLRVGIDPADDTFKVESEKNANLIIQDYFSAKVFKESRCRVHNAKVITCISMFYDLADPDSFLQDVNEVLDKDGIFVVSMSYTPLMISQLAFDNICHEHQFYYSLFNFKNLVEKNGFKIMDAQLNDTNGGSFRVYMMKKEGDENLFGAQPYRDVCNFRISSLLHYERNLNLDSKVTWLKFFDEINKLKEQTVSFIKRARLNGQKVYGYGASTKFNSLLQWFGLDNTMITAIAERSEYKYGLRTVGTNIPIISEEQMRKDKPDYLILGPWFFVQNFREREKKYLEQGGKFIVTMPKFEIIGA